MSSFDKGLIWGVVFSVVVQAMVLLAILKL